MSEALFTSQAAQAPTVDPIVGEGASGPNPLAPISHHGVPARPEGVAARLFHGEAILVSSRTYSVVMLNHSASQIWKSIDGRRSVSEIADRLCALYAIERADALETTWRFLSLLVWKGLAHWATAGAPCRDEGEACAGSDS